ncbi:MAG TPA: alpha-L-arabinofuranosidase C-terminal domain-containing protein [Chloroflexota bacterium]|nr:alpha-L-arabinofuranosidase C-terminal domain-containing protein [Chloroflexota bacterium]
MKATVHLDTQHHVGPIDRRVFSGFLEHLGRAVYEGVYDPGNPRSDEQGFRQDVLEALRPLGMATVRYPGGNFVSCYDWKDGIGPLESSPPSAHSASSSSNYDWKDGIGPLESRAARPDYAWRTIESNQFGTDQFMAWSRQLDTEPMMAVNLGTGNTADAAALLEYCNLPGGTYWADQRTRHGNAEPYGAKLWCLGNEMDGPWQAGHVPAAVYAQRAWQAGQMMKGLDPTIETVACGSSHRNMRTYLEWDREVLEYCWDHVDYISAHRYSENRRDDSAWYLAEGLEIDRTLEDYAGLLNYVRGVKKSGKRVYLSFDEWNVWYRARDGDGHWQTAPHLLEEVYNLEDALVCAQYLTSFLRRADVLKIACMAQIVNVIAPILTRPEGLLRQSIYYPFALLSRYAHGRSLTPVIHGPTYQAGDRGEAPVLDAAASYDEETGQTAIFLINRSQGEELTVEIDLADRRFAGAGTVDLLGGGDVKAANSWEDPHRVVPVQGSAALTEENRLRVRVPAPGLAVVRATVAG